MKADPLDKREVDSASEQPEPILEWSVCLAREYPARLIVVFIVTLSSTMISFIMFRSLVFTLVTLFLLFCALAEFVFPVRYSIDKKGATMRTILGTRCLEWSRVKKCYLDEYGIKLSTLGRPSRLEAYRGMYLRFGNRRDEVIQVVRAMRDVHLSGTGCRGAEDSA